MSLSSEERSRELMARVPKPERASVTPVNLEEEPEVESFERRGDRILADAAAKVSSTWAGLRSRLSSFGNRLLGMTKTGIGGAAAGLETSATIAGKTLGGGAEVVRGIPTMARGIGEHLAREASEVGEAYHDMIRPREAADMEKVTQVETNMQRIQDMIAETEPGAARDALVETYEKFVADREALLNTPRSLRGSKAAAEALAATKSGLKKGASVVGTGLAAGAMGAVALGAGAAGKVAEGGRWVGGKVGEMREARRQEQEALRLEHEEACVARAELFLMDAAEASGEPMQKLSREHLLILGQKLEESLARRIAGGVKEMGKAMLFVDDVVDIGRNLKAGALDFAAFARNPEDRKWLMNELKDGGVKIPKALLLAASDVGIAFVAKPGLKAAQFGAGVALASAEAAANSRPARAAKEAVIAKWQEHGPAIQQGFASGVESVNRLADNILDVPDGLERAANDLGEQLNAEAEKASGLFNRMKALVDSAVNIAKRKWNEFMLEVAQGAAKTENPELVAKIGDAVQALEAVEAEEVRPARSHNAPEPRNIKPVIRQVRGSGVAKA